MLKVTHGTDEIKVRFYHRICNPNEIKGITGISVDEVRRCSLVKIILNDRVVGVGMAVCHPMDNFCRATGRKRALADALHTLTRKLLLDKKARTAVWAEYNIQCGF